MIVFAAMPMPMMWKCITLQYFNTLHYITIQCITSQYITLQQCTERRLTETLIDDLAAGAACRGNSLHWQCCCIAFNVFQCISMYCNVLPSMYINVLQCISTYCNVLPLMYLNVLQCVAFNVFQCIASCCL